MIEILLVEDDPHHVKLITEVLVSWRAPVRVSVARDGEEACAYMRREGAFADAPDPSLILLDLNMPRVDGREALRILKEDTGFRRIPVVVYSSSPLEMDVLEVYDHGASCFVWKPADPADFRATVEAIATFW